MRRFFVPPGTVSGRDVTLGPELARRLARVLRLRRGDHVVLAMGGPREYEVQFTALSANAATAIVVSELDAPEEPHVELVLYQSLIRPNRFDLVLEKGTEIGVSRFVPVVYALTQGQFEEQSGSRVERWERIIVEAAEQCGRGRLPLVSEVPLSFEEALRMARGLRLVCWESEPGNALSVHLRGLAERPTSVSVFIGPEGGLTEDEVALARERGAALVSLGKRVMRSETAGIVASALVLDALG